MARIDEDFSNHRVETNSTTVPDGVYPVTPIDSEWREPISGDGTYLQVAFRVLGGEHADKVLFDRFHLKSSSVATVTIAKRNFRSLCEAAGLERITDSTQLHNKPIAVRVVTRTHAGTTKNTIVEYQGPPGRKK